MIVIGQSQLIAIMAHQRRTRGRIWTHLDVVMVIRWQKPDDCKIVARDREIVAHNGEIVAHDREIVAQDCEIVA